MPDRRDPLTRDVPRGAEDHFSPSVEAAQQAIDAVVTLESFFSGMGVSSNLVDETGRHRLSPAQSQSLQTGLRSFHRAAALARSTGRQEESQRILQNLQQLSSATLTFMSDPGISAQTVQALQHPGKRGSLHLAETEAAARQALDRATRAAVPSAGSKYDYTQDEATLVSTLRAARGGKRVGIDVDEGETKYFEEARATLTEEITDLREQFKKATDPHEISRIGSAIAGKSNLLSQLETLFRDVNKESSTGLKKTINAITSVVGALSVTAMASKFAIQDPYQFETMPAIRALSAQGDIGQMMGSALQQQEQYRLGIDQTIFSGGAGLMMSGLGMLGSGNVGGAIASLVGGGAMALLGQSGMGTDFLQSIGLAKNNEDIIGVNLAQQLLNPSLMVGHWEASRTGLMAVGQDQENFGYYYGTEAARRASAGGTGNLIIDRMFAGNPELYALGMDPNSLGSLMSSGAMQLTGRHGIGIEDATVLSARMGGAFGIDPEAMMSMISTAQAMGSRDIDETMKMFLGASADAEGNLGPFETIITKSLLETAHSLKLQNIARDSDELQKEVATFRAAIVDSGSPLGDVITTNPQVFAQVMNMVQSGVKMSLNDPALMAFDLSLGHSYEDIVMGRASVMESRLGFLTDNVLLQDVDFGDMDSVFRNPWALGAIQMMKGFTGIDDIQIIGSLIEAIQSGETLSDERVAEISARFTDEGQDAIDDRLENIIGTPLTTLIESFGQQTSAMMASSQTVIDTNLQLNKDMLNFVKQGDFMRQAQEGLKTIEASAKSLIAGVFNNRGGPAEPNVEEKAQTVHGYLSLASAEESAALAKSYQSWKEHEGNEGFLFNEYLGMLLETGQAPPLEMMETGGHATGGYTGFGNRLTAAGVVHGGEFVISDQNVRNNREILERIQSGEDMSVLSSNMSTGGETVELTMRVSGMSMDQLKTITTQAVEDYVVKNRLIYP